MLNSNVNDDDRAVYYFNNAGQARLAENVKLEGVKRIQLAPWDNIHEAELDQARIRELFGGLIEADAKDIAIVPCTSFAISLAAHNVERKFASDPDLRGRILILQDQFCSAVYPWQDLCTRSVGKWTLEIVPYPVSNWTEAVLQTIQAAAQDTVNPIRVACLPPLHWSDGALLDLLQISKVCREQDILLIVDATQAVGAMSCSIKSIQPAMLACSVHKWLRAPPGASLVYINPDLHDTWEPLDEHARSRAVDGGADWDASKNEMGPHGYSDKFLPDARKFDSGGKPNPILLPMIRASLEVVATLDLENVQSRLKALIAPLIDWALANGFELTKGGHSYHIVGIRPLNMTTQEMIDIAHRLEAESIFLAVRCGAFRVSAYLDNTPDEVQQLIGALQNELSENQPKDIF